MKKTEMAHKLLDRSRWTQNSSILNFLQVHLEGKGKDSRKEKMKKGREECRK
jgi:hypothetical protein